MFSNFKKAFITRPQFTTKTPSIILENAAKDLPDGFRYVDDPSHPGFCRLDCSTVMDIHPFSFRLEDDPCDVFKGMQKVTMADLLNYCYNSQTKAELLPDGNGDFLVNGEKINRNKFVLAPLKDLEFHDGRLAILPPPFPDAFAVELCGNGKSKTLLVQRQPNYSLNIQKFSSINTEGLQLTYTFDVTKKSGKMNIKLSIAPSAIATIMLESNEILNSFLHGTGTMCGMPIKADESSSAKDISNEVLGFWRKVVAIEQTLSVKFTIDQKIEIDDVKYVNMLYRCFVEKKPYKEYRNDAVLNGNAEYGGQEPKDILGKELLLEFVQLGKLEIFGISVDINCLVALFNGVVTDMSVPDEENNGGFSIKFISAPGKKMYASKMWFRDINDLNEFKEKEDYHSILQTASELEQ